MPQVDTLNSERLAAYLEANVAGFKGSMRIEKFAGGQSNPTFRIKAASGEYVLRRQPPGELLKSAHAVDREFRVMNALADTEVPVPKMYHLCEDREVIGSMFYLMELCRGRVLWDAALPEADNAQRGVMYDEMNRVLAALHEVDLEATGLTDYGKRGNYFARQVGRWTKQYRASETHSIPAMEELIAWLEANMPADEDQVALVHGDYNLNNMIWHPHESRVIAVIDWELSTLGHPLADLAYQCMRLRMPPAAGRQGTLYGKDRAALGIPSEEEYVVAYCQRRGLSQIEHWLFYLAFSFFRLAAICQGIAKRVQLGNASSKQAGWAGQAVQPLAWEAMKIVREGA
jgi:aminoglycoside phosphotransferase (APT) family kinase protein